MRWVVVTILASLLLLGTEPAALAKKVPCKKIKEAMTAGKTADQVAKELGTRVKRVENCMSGKKGKKAGGAASTADADEEDEEE